MRLEITLFVLLLFVISVSAVPCPDGFEWQRMSGVGCVQKDCFENGGYWSDTGRCNCNKKKACYEPVKYGEGGFNGDLCKPFCPFSRLTICADDATCPGEKPTQEDCESYCISYHGPHAIGRLVGDNCDCGCEEGYTGETNKVLLCQPTKATCDKYCKEYHSGDVINGENTYGTVRGLDCDCHCNKGYIPDNTLSCVKAPSCQKVCESKMGEGAIGTGTYPDCNCDCKKAYRKYNVYDKEQKVICKKIECPENSKLNETDGKCICNEGFWKEPIDGVCVSTNTSKTCGNGKCETNLSKKYPVGADWSGDIEENCANCPADCRCTRDEVCNPSHPIIGWMPYERPNPQYTSGCILAAAQIVDFGCVNGSDVPKVSILRSNINDNPKYSPTRTKKDEINGQVGMLLNEGDELTLHTMNCKEAYVVMAWNDPKDFDSKVVRTMMYVRQLDAYFYTLKIGKNAVESGWPSNFDTAKNVGGILIKIWRVVSSASSLPVSSFISPRGNQQVVKVYIKSDIIVNQSPSGVTVYTLEGEPIVEYMGKNVTVYNGTKVTVDSNGMSNPATFKPTEPGDWYLKIPDPPDNLEESSRGDIVAPDLDLEGAMSNIGSAIEELQNTCCGSVGMVAMLLVLAAWSGKKVEGRLTR